MRNTILDKTSPWLAMLFVFSLSLMCLVISGCHMTCNECGTSSVECAVGACANSCEPYTYLTFGKYKDHKDHFHTLESARLCAVRDLYPKYAGTCAHSVDFERGFIQAYKDVLTGGTGKTPPIPPERYWTAHYRTRGGHSRASDWFVGYQAGSTSVKAKGVTDWIQIPSTDYVRQAPQHSQHVIPSASDLQGQYGLPLQDVGFHQEVDFNQGNGFNQSVDWNQGNEFNNYQGGYRSISGSYRH